LGIVFLMYTPSPAKLYIRKAQAGEC
jgi:hypothetical protein